MNASDTRNKSGKVSEGMGGKQSNVVKEMANNTTLLGLGAAGGAGGGPRKQLLVMDEVDGMSGELPRTTVVQRAVRHTAVCSPPRMLCARHGVANHACGHSWRGRHCAVRLGCVHKARWRGSSAP